MEYCAGQQRARLCASALLTCLVIVLAAVAVALTNPARAFAADDYTISRLDITAEVQTDAALHVVEVRTFERESITADLSWLAFDPMPDNASITVNSMRVGFLDEEGNLIDDKLEELPQISFQTSYRTGVIPKGICCSYDKRENRIYCYYPTHEQLSTSMVVEFDYTVVNGVQLFKDCAELNWKYVNEAWTGASENVEMHISLPVPSGVEAVQGENVFLWGHGPSTGTVSGLQGSTITFTAERVNTDTYAETRILFPTSWMTHVTNALAWVNKDSVHFDWALEQEQNWSDASRVRAKQADVANCIACGVCIVLVLASMVICLVMGSTRKPRSITKNAFELESLDLHPALFGRLARWNRRDDADLIATVEHLDRAQALRVSPIDSNDARIECMLSEEEMASASLHALDVQAIDLLFTRIAAGARELAASDIIAYAHAHPDDFVAAMGVWSDALDDCVKKAHLFDVATARWARILRWLAGLMVLFALCAYVIGQDTTMAVVVVASAVVVGLFSYYTKRMTQGGSDLYAEQAFLQQTLKASDQDIFEKGDAQAWGVLLNRAYLLDVANEAAASLKFARGDLFAEDAAADQTKSAISRFAWFAEEDEACIAQVLQHAIDNAFAASQNAKGEGDAEVRAFRKLLAKRKK